MFISLLFYFAGLITGLGAVGVIATLAFLGRKSAYYTEATLRAHKITKPLIWLGWLLATSGGAFFYQLALGEIPFWQLLFFIPLTLNGLWLTYKVSPYLIKNELVGQPTKLVPDHAQRQITISFIISLLTWWAEVILLVAFLSKD